MNLKAALAVTLQALALSTLAQVKAPDLTPGMTAPKLEVAGWVKGSAPAAKKGRLRIVEFWATWCEPCHRAVPHLAELARRHADRLDVVGVSVLETPTTKLEDLRRFVESQKEMTYPVAYDDEDRTAAIEWLIASDQTGVPISFLLDDANRILWTGHPLQIDAPLKEALAAKIDVEAHRRAFIDAALTMAEIDNNRAAVAKAAKRYLAGEKTEAERDWDAIASKSKRVIGFVRESRLSTYPFGSPEGKEMVEAFLTGSDEDQARLAMVAAERAKAEPFSARRVVERVVREAKGFLAIYQAGLAHGALGLPEAAITTLDLALATYAKSPKRSTVIDFPGMIERAKGTVKTKTS